MTKIDMIVIAQALNLAGQKQLARLNPDDPVAARLIALQNITVLADLGDAFAELAAEAMTDETTIAQVFAKAPPYTEAERALVVQKFRESREQFVSQGKVTKEKKPKAAKAEGAKLSVMDLDLS